MELRNFKLEDPIETIAFEGCGHYWDVHSFADLTVIKYFTVENTVEFHWRAHQVENAWGDESNLAKGLILRFTEVRFLEIVQLDESNTNEDDCVAGVSQVTPKRSPDSKPIESRMKEKWDEGEDFGLFFELQSGRTIEIHAKSAELVPLSEA